MELVLYAVVAAVILFVCFTVGRAMCLLYLLNYYHIDVIDFVKADGRDRGILVGIRVQQQIRLLITRGRRIVAKSEPGAVTQKMERLFGETLESMENWDKNNIDSPAFYIRFMIFPSTEGKGIRSNSILREYIGEWNATVMRLILLMLIK